MKVTPFWGEFDGLLVMQGQLATRMFERNSGDYQVISNETTFLIP